jgi:hypothetical protein
MQAHIFFADFWCRGGGDGVVDGLRYWVCGAARHPIEANTKANLSLCRHLVVETAD